MARYLVATEDARCFTVVDVANNFRPVRDPQADAPLVWDSVEDATWYADKRNGLWTHEEILTAGPNA